jgi:Lrp/AsnC family leucine-responsive transcriptional regulator
MARILRWLRPSDEGRMQSRSAASLSQSRLPRPRGFRYAMDKIDRKLLDALQHDARLSYRELGKRVGLTAPAVAERVRKLEVSKVITGYHARVNPAAFGHTIEALMTVSYASQHAKRMYKLAQSTPEILECLHVTGHGSVVLRVVARSTRQLEELMLKVQQIGATETSIILSVPFRRDAIEA